MAEGFLREWGGDRFNVNSAGTHPARRVSPFAVEVMKEVGIDISKQAPKSIVDVENDPWDWVITVCDNAKQLCPVFQARKGLAKQLHWSVVDPYDASDFHEELVKAYRIARDDLAKRIKEWLKEEYGIEIQP
jgi:arsenate reductase (thioredoxin)